MNKYKERIEEKTTLTTIMKKSNYAALYHYSSEVVKSLALFWFQSLVAN